MEATLCYCTSGLNYTDCCKVYHTNQNLPNNPEALMRSRFSAYALHLIDYLIETTHPTQRHLHTKKSIKTWASQNVWLRLEICFAKDDIVEFKAYYQTDMKINVHHERSIFKIENEKWYYLSGTYFD